ncbi:MAG: DNA-directed DNA polymerase [Candidatus Hadarchaeales archaeon]
MRGVLLDVEYDEVDGRPVIKLLIKGEKETFTAIDASLSQYFYVVAEDPQKVSKFISELEILEKDEKIRPKGVEVVRVMRLGRELEAIKVLLLHPKHLTALRHAIRGLPKVKEIFGYDIPPARRYLIDTGLVPMGGVEVEGKVEEVDGMKTLLLTSPPRKVELPLPELNIMSFDIEVYNPVGTPRPEKDPILMISLADNHGLRKVITWKEGAKPSFVDIVGSEREMVEKFMKILKERKVDILLGYNTDFFDFPYLIERARQLKLGPIFGKGGITTRRRKFATATKLRSAVHVDLFAAVNFLATIGTIRLIHYTLEDVYRHLLGKEKPDFEFTKFVEAWEKGGKLWQDLLDYSLSDAVATLEIGLEILPLFIELSRAVGQTLFDVTRMSPGQLVEWLLISSAHRFREMIPARPVGEEFEERAMETYTGAYVMEPVKGLHENLVVFDFRSLYPSIIVTHNIDPSTLNCECCSPSVKVPELGHHFCQKNRGFIPATLEEILKERLALKEEMKKHRKGTKEYQSLYTRQWAFKILANSFYGMLGYPRARWYCKECAESVTSFGRHYIHQSIKMAEDFGFKVIYGDTDSLHCRLEGKSKEDALKFLAEVNRKLPGALELELEGFYPRGIFITKKRYALIDEEGRITVKGLEFVRRDWAAIAKKTQEEVLKAILKDGSKEKAAEIIRETTRKIYEGKIDLQDLIIYTQLKMPIESYRSVGPHVVAAKRLRSTGREVEPGMMIAYVEVRGPGSISERAYPVELLEGKSYDPDYYVNNQVLPAVMRIMEVLGYREDDLKFEKEKQVGLDRFM